RLKTREKTEAFGAASLSATLVETWEVDESLITKIILDSLAAAVKFARSCVAAERGSSPTVREGARCNNGALPNGRATAPISSAPALPWLPRLPQFSSSGPPRARCHCPSSPQHETCAGVAVQPPQLRN